MLKSGKTLVIDVFKKQESSTGTPNIESESLMKTPIMPNPKKLSFTRLTTYDAPMLSRDVSYDGVSVGY